MTNYQTLSLGELVKLENEYQDKRATRELNRRVNNMTLAEKVALDKLSAEMWDARK